MEEKYQNSLESAQLSSLEIFKVSKLLDGIHKDSPSNLQ